MHRPSVFPIAAAPRPAALAPLAGLFALALAGIAARDASVVLLTAPPSTVVIGGVLLWIAFGFIVIRALAELPVGRLGRRLLVVAALSVSGWAAGTVVRGATAWVAFAQGPAATGESVWHLVGPGEDGDVARVATSFEYDRSVDLRLTPEAASAARGFACVRLPVERSEGGIVRVRMPDEGVGPEAVVDCPPQGLGLGLPVRKGERSGGAAEGAPDAPPVEDAEPRLGVEGAGAALPVAPAGGAVLPPDADRAAPVDPGVAGHAAPA